MNIPESTLNDIRSLVADGNKIQAIKLLRKHHPVSLADAVPLVEWIAKNDPSIPMPQPIQPASHGAGANVPVHSRQTGNRVLWIFPGVGLILLAIAAWLVFREVSFRREATRVEGVVVENLRVRRSFTPVFEYKWKGEVQRSQANFSSSINGRPAYAVGEKIVVMVHPDDPEKASIASFVSSWLAATIVGGIGAIFTLIGFGLVFAFRRR